jgi:hypothetical protein
MTYNDESSNQIKKGLSEINALMKQSRDWNFIWREMSSSTKEQFHKKIQEKRILDCLKIIELLNKNKINFVVLKGLTIQYFNKNRRFDDLDIYVPQGNFERATALMERLGFSPIQDDMEKKQRGSGISHHVLFHKANQIDVELHYRLFHNTSIIEKKLPVMEEKQFLEIDGIKVPCLRKELQLLGIFLHNFYNHGFLEYYGKMFEDTECLLQNYDMDWNTFLLYVRKTGYHELLFTIINLLNVFNRKKLRIPDFVVQELRRNSSVIRLQLTKRMEINFFCRYCEIEKLPSSSEKADLTALLDWEIKYYLLFSLGLRSDFFRLLKAYNLFSANTIRRFFQRSGSVKHGVNH